MLSETTATEVVPKAMFLPPRIHPPSLVKAEDYQDSGMSMITIGGLARVIVSGNHRFIKLPGQAILSSGHQLRLVHRP